MKIKDVIASLEEFAPSHYQENYDNSGLLVGNRQDKVNAALVALDCTEEIIEEAIQEGCDLVIAHHPILFGNLNRLNGSNYVERTIIKAIKNDIAIYAIHTNLDNVLAGVNQKLADTIGLSDCKLLSKKHNLLSKLVFFCPVDSAEKVKQSIFEAGAGKIGNYDCCSFEISGEGNFRANEGSNPYVGNKGEIHKESELRIETIFPKYLKNRIVSSMIEAHPYEEVAYDIYALENNHNEVGSGMLGNLETELDFEAFLNQLKSQLNVPVVKHTKILKEKVKKIAICGGSGSFLLQDAIRSGADVFISADFKYHQYFDAEDQIVIIDVGHYESEQFTPELIQEVLQKKIPNFATYLSKINTNPINYS